MSQLTKRERVLLMVLAIMIVGVVGIVYGILPLQTKLTAINQENQQLKAQKQEMDMKISVLDKSEERKKELQNEVTMLLNNINDPLKGESFDKTIASVASQYGLRILSVNYSDVSVVKPTVSGSPSLNYEYNLKTILDSYQNSASEDFTEITTEQEVLKQTISLAVEGNYSSITQLLKELNRVGPTVYVQSINYQNNSQSEAQNASLSIDVYFVDKQ